jgi:malate dehydrogenase
MASFALRGPRAVVAVCRNNTAPGPLLVARRGLGDTVVGPPVTDFAGNLRIAKNFFTKGSTSYAEFKQQCVSLRFFVFSGVTAGCVVSLFWNPPKSSYWQRYGPSYWWSHVKGCFSSSAPPVFLGAPLKHEVDVPSIVGQALAGSLGAAAKVPTEVPAEAPVATTPAPAAAAPAAIGQFKVCVCGGAGGIGQPLSMLMALDERVGELCVFDLNIAVVPAQGVAADLSHLERPSKVKAYSLDLGQKPVEDLGECLKGCDLVLVPAGLPRKPGMTRADLLATNAGIAKGIVEACAKHCPDAVVALIVNPVNSVVPAMAELYKKAGKDPSKIVGVTSLDVVRANKFVHEITDVPLSEISVPVIGGHAGETILPVFSQVEAAKSIPAEQLAELDKRVQDAGTEVVNAKKGKGSATLSMAYAGARLGKAVLAGLAGETGVEEYAYVGSSITDLPYFASKVTFGKAGVETVHPLPSLSAHEEQRLAAAKELLKGEIQAGLDYAAGQELA